MKKTTLIFTLFLSLILAPLYVSAQNVEPGSRDRDAWMKEMQQFKNDFISRKLDLTDEQKNKFLPLYNQMDEEVRGIQEETRNLEKQTVEKGDKATELEYEKAAEALYELKGRENVIEMKYFDQFKKILTPKQLFKLKESERDFTRELMNQRRRHHKR